jgi:hypothetical protein
MAAQPATGQPPDPVAPVAASGSLPVPDVKLTQKAKTKPLLISDIFKPVVAAKSKAPLRSDPPKPDVAPATPKKRKVPVGKRKLVGIDGICRRGEALFVLARFEDSKKAESVPIDLMHQFYLNQLLAFYEQHIILCSADE